MSIGAPLIDGYLESTNPASFARRKEVFVYERGTEVEAQLYADEALTEPITQPLITDKGGRPRDKSGRVVWVDPTSTYDVEIDGETVPWNPPSTGPVDLSGYQQISAKGAANGYASLEAAGKVPAAQLPSAIMEYQGTWNASTNTPKLEDGKGSNGDVYRVSIAAERNLGSGTIDFKVGDYAIYNGSTWEKSDTTDAVASVAGKTGAVTLGQADIEGLVAGLEGKQPLDADLTAISGLSSEDQAILVRSGGSWAALAKGAAGEQLIVRSDGTLAWVKPTAIKAAAWGVKADGVTNDSAALDATISTMIEKGLPGELPEGEIKTTKEHKAVTDYFAMYGAGATRTKIVPEKSTYNALVVGPGAEGSGNRPSLHLRDFGIAGGNAAITTAGVEKTTGKAALVLDGMRLGTVERVSITGAHDIGFDLTHNCFGVEFKLCRTDLNCCRVGVNLRKGEENGEDILFTNCWFAGEVAAMHVASSGKNYRVIGGQLSAARQNTVEEDLRGVVILCKDYLTGATVEGGEVHMQLQTSFEFFPKVWAIRSFGRIHLELRSSFNPNGAGGPAIGFFKGSSLVESVVRMDGCNIHGKWIKYGEGIVKLEGANSDFQWKEIGSWGIYENSSGSESTHAEWAPIWLQGKITNSGGSTRSENIVHHGNGVLAKAEGEALKWSRDWGSTWKYLTPEGKTYASANTMTLDAGIALAKITGTTEIKKINATFEGHSVTLKFAGALTVKKGENLELREDMVMAAGSVLTLICDGTNWYQTPRDYQKAVAPTALAEKAEKTEVEPSATRTAIVTGRVETASATRTVIRILVGATIVAELEASVTVTGKSLLPFCFTVPAGSKWKWEKVEGTVETNGFKFSTTVI